MVKDSDIIGGFPYVDPNCKGCGKLLLVENAWMADGCPCNTPLGVNSMNETRWRLLMMLQQQHSREAECKREAERKFELERARADTAEALVKDLEIRLRDAMRAGDSVL